VSLFLYCAWIAVSIVFENHIPQSSSKLRTALYWVQSGRKNGVFWTNKLIPVMDNTNVQEALDVANLIESKAFKCFRKSQSAQSGDRSC